MRSILSPARLIILGFSLFIGGPIVIYAFNLLPNNPDGSPKQQLAFPEIQWDFLDPVPDKIESVWANQFGGQAWLKHYYEKSHANIQLSPIPEKVLMGQEGWLFQANTSLEQLRGTEQFSDAELILLKERLAQRQAAYAAQGTQLQIVVIPNKSALYPEHLPTYIQADREVLQTQQLMEQLADMPKVHSLELLPILQSGKWLGRLYDKTDSHWTDLGAFIAYHGIISQLKGTFPALSSAYPLDSFVVQRFTDKGRNLAHMMGMENRYQEEAIALSHKGKTHASAYMSFELKSPTGFLFPESYFLGFKNDRAKGPKVLIIRDSFTTQLIPMLNEHFSETYYLWDQWFYGANLAVVNKLQPELVIVIILQEHLRRFIEYD